MIYGKIAKYPFPLFTDQLFDLKDLMIWPGCLQEDIVWGSFAGGVIYDPRLPYKIDDFYCLDEQKDLMVLMSGTIYNQNEIVKLLSNNDSIMTAPRLVIEAFGKWGKEFVRHLNGDFAIYIYQKLSNHSFLYRDHMGVRPLNFSEKTDELWFSSDGIALCKSLYGNEGVDLQFMVNYLINYGLQSSFLPSESSLLPSKKVQKVLPGHYLHQSVSGLLIKKYWIPEDIREDIKLDFEKVTTEIKSLVVDAVKIRSDQRFKAASHLSGGLDSGIVASLAKKAYKGQEEFTGFCWTPLGSIKAIVAFDERKLVRNICEFTGINPIFTIIDTQDYIDFLSEWRADTDLFYEFKVRETGRLKQINLIFSGWGGDEFISFGNPGIDSDLVFKFQWHSFFLKNPIRRPKQLIAALFYNVLLPALSLKDDTLKWPLSKYSKYLKTITWAKPKKTNNFYSWRSRNELHLRFLYLYHISERTEDWNINGTRSGIEYRYPLIDKRIIEFVLKVPSRLLFKNGYSRILLREISEGLLPEEIRWSSSKNDPVRTEALVEILDNVCIELMNDVDELKKNPELGFIDFDLLVSDIDAYRKGLIKERPSKSFEILLFLKKVHEFTKVYSK